MENNESIGSDSSEENGSFGHQGGSPREQSLELTILVDTTTRSPMRFRLAPRPQPTWALAGEAFRMCLTTGITEPSAESEAAEHEPRADVNAEELDEDI
jgi:hypothetical protein